MKHQFILIIFSLAILAGCVPYASDTNVSATPENPTKTPMSFPSRTITSIPPTLTARPTETPTLTPFPEDPTLGPEEMIAELLRTNGGCDLPCLLGAPLKNNNLPNVVSLIRYLERINTPLNVSGVGLEIETAHYYDLSGASIQLSQGDIEVEISLSYYRDKTGFPQGTLSSSAYLDSGNNRALRYGVNYYRDLLQYFSLENILNIYGQPSQILIAPFPDDFERPDALYAFSMVIHYPKDGFIVQYVSPRVKIGENFVGCPRNSFVDVSAWDVQSEMTLEDAVQHFSGVDSINLLNLDYFKPIEEVSNYDIQSFYETFKVRTDKCIETPKKLWPTPEP